MKWGAKIKDQRSGTDEELDLGLEIKGQAEKIKDHLLQACVTMLLQNARIKLNPKKLYQVCNFLLYLTRFKLAKCK